VETDSARVSFILRTVFSDVVIANQRNDQWLKISVLKKLLRLNTTLRLIVRNFRRRNCEHSGRFFSPVAAEILTTFYSPSRHFTTPTSLFTVIYTLFPRAGRYHTRPEKLPS